MIVIEAHSLTKDFHLGKTLIHALRGVDIEIRQREFLAIAGPSGSGKTTLLNLLGCIDEPTSGSIKLDGVEVTQLSSNQLADLRYQKLGFIFQTFNLIPVLSAFENVEYPLLKRNISKKERKQRVVDALTAVGIENFQKHKPEELSGGQRQRVAIARALVGEPEIILADEPTANLDQQTGTVILEIMKHINEANGTIFVFSTHDPKIMDIANRVVQLRDGQVVNSGS